MTTETMTAEDAEWANESGLAINNLPSAPPCITERILATYTALADLREAMRQVAECTPTAADNAFAPRPGEHPADALLRWHRERKGGQSND